MKQIPDAHSIGSGQVGATRKSALKDVKMVVCRGHLITLL